MTNSGDAVALARDDIGNVRDQPCQANPFESVVFVKNCFASGSIVPPSGEGASVRRTDLLVGWCVLCLVACGLMFAAVALYWRA